MQNIFASQKANWLPGLQKCEMLPQLEVLRGFYPVAQQQGNTGLDLKYTLMSFSTARPAD